MGNCKDCQNPTCPKCGTTHSVNECIQSTRFKQVQQQFNQKRSWEEPNIQ